MAETPGDAAGIEKTGLPIENLQVLQHDQSPYFLIEWFDQGRIMQKSASFQS
ncbi:MAG: hypothetical protein ACYCZJ_04085 [Sulfuriferula sp.]